MFIAIILILEIVLRIFNIGYGNSPLESDSILHHKHPKNYTFLSHTPSNEYGGFLVHYDKEGLVSDLQENENREDISKAENRIAFLGDSFVEGGQVPYAKSFVGIISTYYGKKALVKNYGVSSYSPVLYYLQLKKILPIFKPTHVFLLLSRNDIFDDNYYLSLGKFSPTGDLLAVPGGGGSILTRLFRKSYVIRYFRRIYLVIKYKLQHYRPNEQVNANFITQEPDISNTTAEYLMRIAKQVKETGAEFILLPVPNTYNYFHGVLSKGEFSRKCESWANKNSIPFIDLIKPFNETHRHRKKTFL